MFNMNNKAGKHITKRKQNKQNSQKIMALPLQANKILRQIMTQNKVLNNLKLKKKAFT